jgi:hypothetical protein
MKEGRLEKKMAASREWDHRSFTERLVGKAGHSNKCLVEWLARVSALTRPTVTHFTTWPEKG